MERENRKSPLNKKGARSAGRLEGTRNKLFPLGVSSEKSARKAQNVFAGETGAQALAREDKGNRGVRPEQVAITTGGARGQSTVGITGPTSGRGTRGGLAIN